MPWGWGRGACTNLQHCHVRGPVGSVFAAVDFHVFQPLDVRLGIAVDLAVKLHIAPNHHSLVGREPCLQDWSVGWPFWKTGKRINLNLLVLFSPSKYSLKHSSSGFSGERVQTRFVLNGCPDHCSSQGFSSQAGKEAFQPCHSFSEPSADPLSNLLITDMSPNHWLWVRNQAPASHILPCSYSTSPQGSCWGKTVKSHLTHPAGRCA